MLYWSRPFATVRAGGFADGDIVWFPEGGLNASYNCVDRWAHKNPDAVSENLFRNEGRHSWYPPAFGALALRSRGACVPASSSVLISKFHILTSLSYRSLSSGRLMSQTKESTSPMASSSVKFAALPMYSSLLVSARVIPSPSTFQ